MAVDYSLYLITDRHLVGNKDFYRSVIKALEGGVTLLQVREKNVSSREFYEISLKLKKIARQYDVPLIINDRLDIALAVDADGLHIGQDDLPVATARKLLGREKILGYSVSNEEEALYGERHGADYLGAGPVYATDSKKDAGRPIGTEGLKKIKQTVNIPVVGIGGISAENLADVKRTGADGISVISAILSRDDTYRAAKELIDLWNE
ncbi:MAG: thiamine phosphate synthase [Thermoanaerobacteraceae bacterium]|nr:thiamine phosphate synthase [Thermoanaerobacteraceae bacterium]